MPDRIPTHRPAYLPDLRRLYDDTTDRRADKAFYTGKPWRRLRQAFLNANPICAKCEREGVLTLAHSVHHKVERKDNPDLAMEWDNLESLCDACHNVLHKAK